MGGILRAFISDSRPERVELQRTVVGWRSVRWSHCCRIQRLANAMASELDTSGDVVGLKRDERSASRFAELRVWGSFPRSKDPKDM